MFVLQASLSIHNNAVFISVDGECMSWTAWSTCSLSCGVGNQIRTRNCTQAQNGGKACTCNKLESQSCLVVQCPVNGNWGEWSPWNACSISCGSGMTNRTRNCDSPEPKFGGKFCNGTNTDNKACNDKSCPGMWPLNFYCEKLQTFVYIDNKAQ